MAVTTDRAVWAPGLAVLVSALMGCSAAVQSSPQAATGVLRTGSGSTELVRVASCTTLGCGDRGTGPMLEEEIARTEVIVPPGSEVSVDVVPGGAELRIAPKAVRPELQAAFATDSRTLTAPRFTAPSAPGRYRYHVDATWEDGPGPPSDGALRSARWLIQLRVQ